MAVLSFFATLLLISYGATAFDLMRYASDQYTILYREFVNSSGTFYPAYGHPLQQLQLAGQVDFFLAFSGIYMHIIIALKS
jgi:hypothetical protein